MTFSRCWSQWWITFPPSNRKNEIFHSLKLQLKRQTGEEKRYSGEAQVWTGSDCSTLEEGLGCNLALASGLDRYLWPPAPCGRNRGSYSAKAWELGAKMHLHLGTLVLTPEGLSWKARSLCCCLRREGRKKHFVDLRTWEEISLILLGCIKIWALQFGLWKMCSSRNTLTPVCMPAWHEASMRGWSHSLYVVWTLVGTATFSLV